MMIKEFPMAQKKKQLSYLELIVMMTREQNILLRYTRVN